jgi:hypothetical protein
MTVQNPFLNDDRFLTRAFGEEPDMREITVLPFCLQ